MSFLKAVAPMLSAHTATISVTFSKNSDGEFSLVVAPFAGTMKGEETPVFQKMKAALSIPLKFTGSLEDIEAALSERVSGVLPRRGSIEAQLDEMLLELEVEKQQKQKTKAAKASTPAVQQRAPEPAVEAIGEDDADGDASDDFEL